MPVTLRDLPKDFLVQLLEDIFKRWGNPAPEEMMAKYVITDRLNRAHREAMAYKKKANSVKKIRAGKARNKVIDQANAHAKKMENLHDSALKLAEEYGLKDQFFKSQEGGGDEAE